MLDRLKQRAVSSNLMWRYILPPVFVVATLWIVMSSATTLYLHWLEQSYRRVFEENVVSFELANDFQRIARRIENIWPKNPAAIAQVRPLCKSSLDELEARESALRVTSHTTAERNVMRELSELLGQFRVLVQPVTALPDTSGSLSSPGPEELASTSDRISEIVAKFTALTNELKVINQELIDREFSRRSRVSKLVYTARLVLLLTGPIVGVWLGWRLSRRLQTSVGRIAVILQQTDGDRIEIGNVTVQSDGILGDVQCQAERIVNRLQDAHCELERARGEIVRSERLAAVGQLAAGVAHELRNPLTSVKLLLQHAAKHRDNQGLRSSQLQLILEEVSRMEATIEGLLDFSRQQPLRRTRHDLNETLRRALNLIDGRARQQGVTLQSPRFAEPRIVFGDAEQLHQVFVNLLINSMEVMPDGGRLSVTVSESASPRRVRIEFHDTGAGISDEILPRLFEPFVTTKERGTGLGLAVSRRIIDQHAGGLAAANDPAGGAVFTVELPIQPATVEDIAAASRDAPRLIPESNGGTHGNAASHRR